jgi:hypothetical protein
MSGMGDGYVGTAQDAARIRRLEKQREAERKKIEELKNKSSGGQTGLLQFGSSTSEVPPVHGSSHLCSQLKLLSGLQIFLFFALSWFVFRLRSGI